MVSRTPSQNATATAVRNGATKVYNVRVVQRQVTAPRLFLQLFNNFAPTVGTTAPDLVLEVPAGRAGERVSRKYNISGSTGGLDYATALAYACTTTHDGLTNPTSGDEPLVEVNFAIRH